MAFEHTSPSSSSPQSPQWAEIALRGTHQMLDMQWSTLRSLAQSQARFGALFGWPVAPAEWIERGAEPLRQALADGAERWLDTTRRAGDTLAEVQRQFGRVVQTQASQAAQTLQQGLEQFSQQASQSLDQWREAAREQADQLERTTATVGDAARSGLRDSSDEWRSRILQGGEQAREAGAQANEATRQQAEGSVKTLAAAAAEAVKPRRDRA